MPRRFRSRRRLRASVRRSTASSPTLAAITGGELGLAPELLLPRRTRERMLDAWEAGRPPGEPLSGWRSEALAAPLAGLAARRADELRDSPPLQETSASGPGQNPEAARQEKRPAPGERERG